jgi:hypothetical protein
MGRRITEEQELHVGCFDCVEVAMYSVAFRIDTRYLTLERIPEARWAALRSEASTNRRYLALPVRSWNVVDRAQSKDFFPYQWLIYCLTSFVDLLRFPPSMSKGSY